MRALCRLLSAGALLVSACASPPGARVPALETLLADEPPPTARRPVAQEVDALSEILVIGRRHEEGVPEVPFDSVASRDVFTPEQVRETGARDLNDLVQHIPAISTRPYNGGEAAAPSFSMRGLPDDGLTEFVHVLIDGVPASPLPYGWTAFSFMPITPERIHAVDYIRGGHTVRYSPDTVGGVLNFVTQPIPQEPTLFTRVTVGDDDFLSAMVSAGGTRDSLGALATYVDRQGDGYRRDGGWDQRDTNLKVRWDIDEQSWAATSVSYMENGHQAPGGLTLTQFAADRFGNARPQNRFDGHRTVADFLYHRDLGDKEGWVEGFAHAATTKRHLRAQRPRFGDATTMSDWQDDSYFWAVGGRAQKEVAQKHTLFGGARFHREWIPDWEIFSEPIGGGPAMPVLDSSFYLSTLSVHLDDTYRPTDDLTLVFGARIEWVPSAKGNDSISGFDFDDDFFTVLPGVGVSYEICANAAVYANYHEGFRAPQVFGFGSARPGDNLDFEESNLAEAGVRLQGWGGLEGSVTGWRTEYDDFHLFTSDGFFENLGRIVAYGVDLQVGWEAGDVYESLEGLSFFGALTLQESELKSGANRGNETPYAWEQKASWRVRYERDGWAGSLGGTFVGESFSDDANTRVESDDGQLGLNPSRTLWDLRIAKNLRLGEQGALEIAAGITNLFDKEWFVHSRGGFFGGGKVAGPPRRGYVSFNLVLDW